jgi:hypothetical protein
MTMVNWDGESRHPCPCGKGESVHRWQDYSSYPGTKYEEHVMLCPDCKDRYAYDGAPSGGHPGNFGYRGWVLKSVLEEERARQDEELARQGRIAQRLDGLYREVWKCRFAGCRTKKDVWRLLTCDGKYHPSYPTFLKHRPGPLADVVRQISVLPFHYCMLRQVFDVCGVSVPDWDSLGVTPEDRRRL